VELDGKALQLEILDTAGQEEYSPLRETFMHTGDGFLLCFSITDDSTYEDLLAIHQQIMRVHENPQVPVVIVGNKVDLEDERAVSFEEGAQLAKKLSGKYMEVGAVVGRWAQWSVGMLADWWRTHRSQRM
jgi:GTPase KRas protein